MITNATAKAPRPRADAVRNRERILAAARESFVLYGLDAPLDEIARRAGVGNATLYRHFPDRKSLLLHVLLNVKQQLVDRTKAAMAAEDDPFETLSTLVLSAAEERIGGLFPLIAGAVDKEDPRLLESRRQLREITERVISRAHASGQLREDVGAGDLLIAIGRLTLTLPGTCGGSEDVALRHLQIFLDGLRTPARSALPGSARNFEDIENELR